MIANTEANRKRRIAKDEARKAACRHVRWCGYSQDISRNIRILRRAGK